VMFLQVKCSFLFAKSTALKHNAVGFRISFHILFLELFSLMFIPI